MRNNVAGGFWSIHDEVRIILHAVYASTWSTPQSEKIYKRENLMAHQGKQWKGYDSYSCKKIKSECLDCTRTWENYEITVFVFANQFHSIFTRVSTLNNCKLIDSFIHQFHGCIWFVIIIIDTELKTFFTRHYWLTPLMYFPNNNLFSTMGRIKIFRN